MAATPDTSVVTAPENLAVRLGDALVTPQNGSQASLGHILALSVAPAAWTAGVDPGLVPLFKAPFACRVAGISGRLETPEGGAATAQPVKAADGTALSAGTNLTSNTFNANGTAATAQTLTLSTTVADITLATGDCIGLVTTGAWTTSVGALFFYVLPVS